MYRLIVVLMFCLPVFISAQESGKYKNDVSSVDSIIAALYDVISGDKGVDRDWDRFRYLFIEEARLMPLRPMLNEQVVYRIMTTEDYITTAGEYLESNGFHEKEIHRKMQTYGSLVHLWSTYESYKSAADTEPFARGINSIQLYNDGERWWVVHIFWLGETEDNPIPEIYLPEPEK